MLSIVIKINIALVFFMAATESLLRAINEHGVMSASSGFACVGQVVIGIALMFARIEWL